MVKKKKDEINLESGGEHRKNLKKLIFQVSSKYDIWQVFSDFCQLSAITLANSSDPHHVFVPKEIWDEREDTYKKVIGKYEKETQGLFSKMFASLIDELQDCLVRRETYEDVLGPVFHDLNLRSKWSGQFFTPNHICNLMGRILDGSEENQEYDKFLEEKGYVSLAESCCGSGALILGYADSMYRNKKKPSKELCVYAADLDEKCVWMTYIQLSLYGIPAIVQNQNSLTMETFGHKWYTPAFIWDGWPIKLSLENQKSA